MFGSRLPLTLGAIAGTASGVVGTAVQGRSSGRLMALGQQVATWFTLMQAWGRKPG